jgi:hypothetical protein
MDAKIQGWNTGKGTRKDEDTKQAVQKLMPKEMPVEGVPRSYNLSKSSV